MLSCRVLGETKVKQQQKWFTGSTKIKCYEDLVESRQWWPWDWFHCDCCRCSLSLWRQPPWSRRHILNTDPWNLMIWRIIMDIMGCCMSMLGVSPKATCFWVEAAELIIHYIIMGLNSISGNRTNSGICNGMRALSKSIEVVYLWDRGIGMSNNFIHLVTNILENN